MKKKSLISLAAIVGLACSALMLAGCPGEKQGTGELVKAPAAGSSKAFIKTDCVDGQCKTIDVTGVNNAPVAKNP